MVEILVKARECWEKGGIVFYENVMKIQGTVIEKSNNHNRKSFVVLNKQTLPKILKPYT